MSCREQSRSYNKQKADAGLLKMKDLTGTAGLAVTIEPRGGKPTPSLETMQVVGSVISSTARNGVFTSFLVILTK